MAYLPKPIEHDLFISYAHEDQKWVSALQEQLTERLGRRLACECDIWQDENKLLTGQDIPKELDKAIRTSAAFIAVLSRDYEVSTWCERELDAFLDEAGGQEMSGYRRVLKIIKFPFKENAHEDFYPAYKHFPFFETDAKTRQEQEFRPNTDLFWDAVNKLSFHIEKLFEAMLIGLEKVFVARAAEDASEERESLIHSIRAEGFVLSPHPHGAIRKGLDRKGLQKLIQEARVTVHLLGGSYDKTVREQIDLAREAGKKMVFYLIRGHETATGEQRTLIDELRKLDLPAGSFAWLEKGNKRQDLIEFIRPPRPAPGRAENGTARVYVLCDPTCPEDAAFAREMQDKIRVKEKFEVASPQAGAGFSSPGAEHERLLVACDGLLLYHKEAPPRWYTNHFHDLLTAEYRQRERKLKSKALLVADANVAFPGLTVIHRSDPFDVEQLEPFLAPLRTLQGGAAHAGS